LKVEWLGLERDSHNVHQQWKLLGTAVIAGMAGRQSLLELGIGGIRKEVVFWILPAQSLEKTWGRSPLAVYTGFAWVWETVVGGWFLGSSCIAGCSPAPGAEALRASEVVMRKMILPFSRDLQDVSWASCL
jgi:hypothetical protein